MDWFNISHIVFKAFFETYQKWVKITSKLVLIFARQFEAIKIS